MPSIGVAALKAALAVPVTVESGQSTSFSPTGLFIGQLAAAIHAGWTCASPTTPSTFVSAFTAAFPIITGGAQYLNCIASGLDAEVAAWVASWNSVAGVHSYTVNATSIYGRITACSPVQSNATHALAQAVANAFMQGFGQEVG